MTPFETAARDVLAQVRGAYARLLADVGDCARAVDVQRSLGLDRKLAWRVHRLGTLTDPLEVAPFVPSATSAARLTKAARARGAPAATGEAVLEATRAFDAFVAEHAPDRTTFDAMAASVGGHGMEQLQFEARRQAFRANVVVHGKLSDLLVYTFLVRPGSEPGTFEGLSLRGHVGLQRLRPDAAVQIGLHRFDADAEALPTARPLDPDTPPGAPPLVRAFSSDAELRVVDAPDGWRRTFLAQPDLGTRSALDCILGDASGDIPLTEGVGSLCELATPARVLVHDMILHEDLIVEAPELRVLARRGSPDAWPEPGSPDVLPPPTTLVSPGRGPEAFALARWSRYAELLEWALAQAGWDPQPMRVHRAEIEYPTQHSVVWLRAARR